jgi:N-acetyl-anhydromuramyl-L-alanine amidase AmpD
MTVKHQGIIVHCTATRPSWYEDKGFEAQLKEIEKWHVKDNGWSSTGYHMIISRDGEISNTRPLGTSGAHARGHNNNIGIALVGGFGSDADDVATDHFTAPQLSKLYATIKDLQQQYDIRTDKIIGHNRVSSKACPGFRVQKWLAGEEVARNRTQPERTKPTQSKTVKASPPLSPPPSEPPPPP